MKPTSTPRFPRLRQHRWTLFAGVVTLIPFVVYASELHLFEPKTVISASKVNENFSNLEERIGVYEGAISVDGNGNVGVGTESPGHALHVVGDLLVQRDSGTEGLMVTSGSGQTNLSEKSGGDFHYRAYEHNFESQDGTRTNMHINRFGDVQVGYGSESDIVKFHVAGDAAFDGNVGIGTTSPDFRLHVMDNLKVSGLNSLITWEHSSGGRWHAQYLDDGTDTLTFRWNPPGSGTDFYALALDNTGNVGIGTTAPAARLHVSGGDPSILVQNSGEADIHFQDTANNQIWEVGTNSLGWYVYDQAGASKTALLVKKSSGNVGIGTHTPTQKLHVVGNVTADDYKYNSDRRLKRDILPLQSALDQVQCLEGVSYRWEAPDAAQDLQVGLIAQDVEACMPEVVTTDPTGYKSVSYARLVAPLIEAVKEQQQLIHAQQVHTASLEARLARLEKLMQSTR